MVRDRCTVWGEKRERMSASTDFETNKTPKRQKPKIKSAVDYHRKHSEHSVHLVHKDELIQQKVQLFHSRIKKCEANVSYCSAKEAVWRRYTKLQAVTTAELCIAARMAKPSCQTSMTSHSPCAGWTSSSPSFFWGGVFFFLTWREWYIHEPPPKRGGEDSKASQPM